MAGAEIKVRVEGLSELRNKLGYMTRLEQQAIRLALTKGALEVERGAKERAPRSRYHKPPNDPSRKVTGDLRRSIGHEVHPTELEAVVGTNLIYGATHEFGDPGRNIPARPYLFPAFEAARNTIVEDFRRFGKAAARRAAK